MGSRDDSTGMQRVRENLLFGDLTDASDHEAYEDNEVDVAFNLCGIRPRTQYPENIQLFDIKLVDGDTCKYENFFEAVRQVFKSVTDGYTVFVHCAAGNSRSVTVSAVVYAILEDTSFQDGMERIHSLRSVQPEEMLLEHGEKAVAEF